MTHLETYRKKHGGDWPKFVRDMKPVIRGRMRESGISCMAEFCKSIEAEMRAKKQDPTFVLAVCEAMMEEKRTKELKS